MYFHGGGWVLGDFSTHERLVRELAVGIGAAVVFVEYDRSPEAKYPIAINQAYDATKWIAKNGSSLGLDTTRIAVAGDSVGGNMTIAVTLLAKQHGYPKLDFQVLFYPVTNASFDTSSYNEFANGPWLTKSSMQFFWDSYTTSEKERNEITASPLRAKIDDLKNLPPALVITDENDVLRDEGEAYARKLIQAGVRVTAVRCLAAIHDFVMLSPIAKAPAKEAAVKQAVAMLKQALIS